MERLKVAHLVPVMNIGGVEVAINKSKENIRGAVDYKVFYIKSRGPLSSDDRSITYLCWLIINRRWVPDVIVTSLWWSHPVGWLFGILSGRKWLPFFHNAGFSNFIDKIVQRWAWSRSTSVLTDSNATNEALSIWGARKAFIVPYLFKAGEPEEETEKDIDFIWVGRNSNVKRFDLYLDIVEEMRNTFEIQFRCAAVLAGEEFDAPMASRCRELGVVVQFNLSNDAVCELLRRTIYFVLTSEHEGMSMTTIEAVQSGCIPLVRRVGEIPGYLGERGGVYIESADQSGVKKLVDDLGRLRESPVERDAILLAAKEGVAGLGCYEVAFNNALSEVWKQSDRDA